MKFGFESFQQEKSPFKKLEEQMEKAAEELRAALKKAAEENIDFIVAIIKESFEGLKKEQPPVSIFQMIQRLRDEKLISRKAAKFLIRELDSDDQSRKEYVEAAVMKILEDAYQVE